MASLRKRPESPYWVACFTDPEGRRTQRSTGTTDRREAQRIANQFEDAAGEGRRRLLTEARARQVIADIYALANRDTLPSSTVRSFFSSWLKRKELEAGEKTHIRYGVTVMQFLDFLGSRADNDLTHLVSRDIAEFRDSLAAKVSPGTVNTGLKILRAALNQAKRDGLVDLNEAERVTLLKVRGEAKRRSFTAEELKLILACADQEWRGMVLVGLYTGARLGDIASLRWGNVDLARRQLTFHVSKTNKPQSVHLAEPLYRHLESLQRPEDPETPLFPGAHADYAKNYFNGLLSKRFHAILVAAGLLEPRKNRATGEGGAGVKHRVSKLSFHSLRHTFVSWLKDSGSSDAVARELAGHDSAIVNRNYTHLDDQTKRNALDRLPDITG
jgi:integrase